MKKTTAPQVETKCTLCPLNCNISNGKVLIKKSNISKNKLTEHSGEKESQDSGLDCALALTKLLSMAPFASTN